MKYVPPTVSFWKYDLGGGWEAWAGKTAEDNDLLSLRVAAPEDFWFHICGMPGSHVLLKAVSDDAGEPTRELREKAAAVAAYHSKARNAGNVSVSCTRAKFVGKPKGAHAGLVEIRQETNLKVKPSIPGPPTDGKLTLE